MNSPTPRTLKRLVSSSVLYIVLALIATGFAVIENRTTEFGGSTSGLSALQSFLYGQGTAMSPPLYWLVAQVGLTAMALRRNRWGSVGVIGLAVFGLFFLIGAIGEPILLESFNPATFDMLNAVILAGLVIVPFIMMVFAILEWSRRRTQSLRHGQPPSQSIDSA